MSDMRHTTPFLFLSERLESFVDTTRFQGTCYRAANWECVGQTRGRGRQGRDHQRLTATVKDIYLYPLHRQFRPKLLEAA